MKSAKYIFIIIFSLLIISNAYASDSNQILKSTNWELIIYDYKILDSKIPVICGLTSISLREGEVGILIEGKLQPSKVNKKVEIALMNDFKIMAGDNYYDPADMCVSMKDKKITLSQDAGKLTDLSKSDFPVMITISYLIPKSERISFSIEDSGPLIIKQSTK